MRKLNKIFMTAIITVVAINLVSISAEAKTKYYDLVKEEIEDGVDGIAFEREGGYEQRYEANTFNNGGTLKIKAIKGYTVLYNYTSKTNNYKKVSTPTSKSKKIKSGKSKKFTIKSNSAFKFKIVKGKVTKAKVKAAKTYYFKCDYNQVNLIGTASESGAGKYGRKVTIEATSWSYDKAVTIVTKNGKTEKYARGGWFGTITGPTTIKITGYKLGKCLGTYTYNYDVQKYTPKKMHDYKLKGSLPNTKYCGVLSIPYGDGYAVSYTLDGSTPTLENGTFMSEFEETTANYGYREETGCYVERFNRYGKVTVKLQLYKKVYVKNTSNKYVFSHYEEVGEVQSKTYKTWAYHTNDDSTEPYTDPKWRSSIMYMSAIAPTTTEIPHLTKVRVTYIDMWGYMVTKELEPGQKLTDVHTRAQRLGWVVSFYVDGENVDEEHYEQEVKAFIDGVNRAGYQYRTVTYQDYLDSFTDHPALVCTGEDLSTPDND